MKKKTSPDRPAAAPTGVMTIRAGVVQEIRQHANSSMKAEICGILLGSEVNGAACITAAIAGARAEEGGAHVTFTQDTWEHIYKIKDRDYPDERIMGWYHSHPGFGVFLSEHDTFIHRNFFSGPQQVAWVFDPHSNEEGCFGWAGDRIRRLTEFSIVDEKGGSFAGESGVAEAAVRETAEAPKESPKKETAKKKPADSDSGTRTESDKLMRLLVTITSHLCAIVLGFAIAWFLFPKILVMPVLIDSQTGQPLPGPPMLIPFEKFNRNALPPVPGTPQRQEKGKTNDVP